MGMTQRQVAECLGVSVRMYQHIESGTRNGKVELWDKLSDLFVVPSKELRKPHREEWHPRKPR